MDASDEIIALAQEVTNPTTPLPLAAGYDSGLVRMVFQKYQQDFAAFGYEEDSWYFHGA